MDFQNFKIQQNKNLNLTISASKNSTDSISIKLPESVTWVHTNSQKLFEWNFISEYYLRFQWSLNTSNFNEASMKFLLANFNEISMKFISEKELKIATKNYLLICIPWNFRKGLNECVPTRKKTFIETSHLI